MCRVRLNTVHYGAMIWRHDKKFKGVLLGDKNVSHDAVKRCVFNSFLKVGMVSELTTLSGSQFQPVGAATEKTQLVKTV